MAFYCTRKCQTEDWQRHKPTCALFCGSQADRDKPQETDAGVALGELRALLLAGGTLGSLKSKPSWDVTVSCGSDTARSAVALRDRVSACQGVHCFLGGDFEYTDGCPPQLYVRLDPQHWGKRILSCDAHPAKLYLFSYGAELCFAECARYYPQGHKTATVCIPACDQAPIARLLHEAKARIKEGTECMPRRIAEFTLDGAEDSARRYIESMPPPDKLLQ